MKNILFILAFSFSYFASLSEENSQKTLKVKFSVKQQKVDSIINIIYTEYDSCFYILDKKDLIRNCTIEKLMYETYKNLISLSRKYKSGFYFIEYTQINNIWYVNLNIYSYKLEIAILQTKLKIKDGKIIAINPLPEIQDIFIEYDKYLYDDVLDEIDDVIFEEEFEDD